MLDLYFRFNRTSNGNRCLFVPQTERTNHSIGAPPRPKWSVQAVQFQCSCSVGCTYTVGTLPLAGSVYSPQQYMQVHCIGCSVAAVCTAWHCRYTPLRSGPVTIKQVSRRARVLISQLWILKVGGPLKIFHPICTEYFSAFLVQIQHYTIATK